MSTAVRKMLTVLGAATMLTAGSSSYALPQLDGSLALAGFGVSQNGANLAVSTTITVLNTLTTDPGFGDYSPVPFMTSFNGHVLDLSSLANLVAGFQLTNPTYGKFVPTAASILSRSANFLDIFFLGDFTPESGLAGFELSPTSLRISLNQSGLSISEAITLNSPPIRITVPEPGTLFLLMTGGFGLLGFGLRRKAQA